METEDRESYVITTNLRSPFQSDSMAFLDTNNYPNIESFIQKNKLGIPMGVNDASGFCTYPLYTLFIEGILPLTIQNYSNPLNYWVSKTRRINKSFSIT